MTQHAGRFDLVTVGLGALLPGTTAGAVVLEGAGAGAAGDTAEGAVDGTDADWDRLRALTLQEMHRHLRRSPRWLPRIGEGVATLAAAGLRACLLTRQPSVLADYAARWGFAEAIARQARVQDGRAVGLDAPRDLAAALDLRLRAWRIVPERVCHVGATADDAAVFGAVGGSVAVFAPPDVAAAAQVDLGAPADFPAVAAAVLRLHAQRGGK